MHRQQASNGLCALFNMGSRDTMTSIITYPWLGASRTGEPVLMSVFVGVAGAAGVSVTLRLNVAASDRAVARGDLPRLIDP